MRDRTVTIGVALLALLSVFDALYPPLFGVGEGATPDVIIVGLVLGVLTLIALGLWAMWKRSNTGRPRAAMWVAVVLRVLSGLSAIPAFFISEVPTGAKIAAAFVVVLTIVGVAMVRSELGRQPNRAGSGARVA